MPMHPSRERPKDQTSPAKMNTIRNAAENQYKPTSNQKSSQEPLLSTTSVQTGRDSGHAIVCGQSRVNFAIRSHDLYTMD